MALVKIVFLDLNHTLLEVVVGQLPVHSSDSLEVLGIQLRQQATVHLDPVLDRLLFDDGLHVPVGGDAGGGL